MPSSLLSSPSSLLLNYSLPLNIGNSYTFNTIAPAILQSTYIDAELVARGDYNVAQQYGNIFNLHQAIYPILISNEGGESIYPNNAEAYEYFIFKLPSNIFVALQSSWIIANSIQEIQSLSLNLTVNSLQSYTDVTRILNAIATLGYTDISSSVSSNISTS